MEVPRKGLNCYAQPSFYRFGDDTIRFVEFVAKQVRPKTTCPGSVLDFGAGCGVIGIEFCCRFPSIDQCSLYEPYTPFHEFLNQNIHQLSLETEFFVYGDYKELRDDYELILCNPPFFERSKCRPSPNLGTNEARNISSSDAAAIVRNILPKLRSTESEAYFLIPSGDRDLFWSELLVKEVREHKVNFYPLDKKVQIARVKKM